MSISSIQMQQILRSCQSADSSSIRRLNQTERKTLLAMFTAIMAGEKSFNINPNMADSIRDKLKAPQTTQKASFLEKIRRIVKALFNYCGFRVGPKTLQEKAASTQLIPDEEIQHFQIVPDEVIQHFQQIEAPNIILEAIRLSPQAETQNIILGIINKDIAQSHEGFSENFEKDLLREGLLIRIQDPSTNKCFVGRSKFEGCSPKDYYESQRTGVETMFSPEEASWNLLVQSAANQTVCNALSLYLRSLVALNASGALQYNTPAGTVYPKCADAFRVIDIRLVRNKESGSIEKAEVTVHIRTIVLIGSEQGIPEEKKIPDRIAGEFDSRMTCTLSLGEQNKPAISDLQYAHVFYPVDLHNVFLRDA